MARTVKQFWEKYCIEGESNPVVKGTQPGLSVTYLTVEKRGSRIFLADDHGDCGLDDSHRKIKDVIDQWLECTGPQDPEFDLWIHPGVE